MKTFDCFLFFNELELLELRFKILYDYVDYFIIVESELTFQGDKKDFVFEKNINRFSKYSEKIIYFKIHEYNLDYENLPFIPNPLNQDEQILNKIYQFVDDCPHFDKKKEFWWGNDFFQRECIWRALAIPGPQQNDLILISDLDEIPNVETLAQIKNKIKSNEIICFKQHEFCYYLNYYHNSNWLGTCGFLYGNFSNVSLNSIRFSTKRNEGFSPIIIENGGWHFTSLGGIEAIKLKILSWGHKEYNNLIFLSGIEYNVLHGYDIFRRPGFGRLSYLQIDNQILPSSLIENINEFLSLAGPPILEENIFFRYLYIIYFKFFSFYNKFYSK